MKTNARHSIWLAAITLAMGLASAQALAGNGNGKDHGKGNGNPHVVSDDGGRRRGPRAAITAATAMAT